MYDTSKVQWTMTVTVYHGSSFGHAIEVVTETKGRPRLSTHDTIGSWRGIGVPAEVLRQARTAVDSIFSDHLVYRYGIQEELPAWPDEVEPF